MRISDWSSDVCSSDLAAANQAVLRADKSVKIRNDSGIGGDNRIRHRAEISSADRQHSARADTICPVGGIIGDGAVGERAGSGIDRKSGVWGQSVSVRVDLGGGRIVKKKNKTKH